jgi:hypothetical protein
LRIPEPQASAPEVLSLEDEPAGDVKTRANVDFRSEWAERGEKLKSILARLADSLKTPKGAGIAAAAVLLFCALAYGLHSLSSSNAGSGGGNSASGGSADVSMTAVDYMKLRIQSCTPTAEEIAHDRPSHVWLAYQGKRIDVTGTVGEISEISNHRVLRISLLTRNGPLSMVRCSCADLSAWEKVSPGAEMTIRGQMPNPDDRDKRATFDLPVFDLIDAEVVKIGHNPAVAITGSELAKKIKSKSPDVMPAPGNLFDPLGFKWLYVEGEIVRSSGFTVREQTLLKGTDGLDVQCVGNGLVGNPSVKTGDRVKLLGKVTRSMNFDVATGKKL